MTRKILILPTALLASGVAVAQEDDSNWKTQVVVPGIHMLESDRGFAGGWPGEALS